MKIVDDPKNPIFVSAATSPRKLLVYIGERKRGKTRIAVVTTNEARVLAQALNSAAERKTNCSWNQRYMLHFIRSYPPTKSAPTVERPLPRPLAS